MERFRAFRIHQEGGKIAARLETIGLDDLGPAFHWLLPLGRGSDRFPFLGQGS